MSVVSGNRPAAKYEGPVAPVVASILGMVAWAVFILVFALFWSDGFSLFQNIIVTIVSLFITGLLIGLMWVVWGPRGAWRGGNVGSNEAGLDKTWPSNGS